MHVGKRVEPVKKPSLRTRCASPQSAVRRCSSSRLQNTLTSVMFSNASHYILSDSGAARLAVCGLDAACAAPLSGAPRRTDSPTLPGGPIKRERKGKRGKTKGAKRRGRERDSSRVVSALCCFPLMSPPMRLPSLWSCSALC